MKIATILTCFNRKAKTIKCLDSLSKALNQYNNSHSNIIITDIYLTDDGCTDGTPDAVRESFKVINVYIVQGDGNLYWAGGMRAAWNAALKSRGYDYYLLINDDTFIYNNALTTLFETEKY